MSRIKQLIFLAEACYLINTVIIKIIFFIFLNLQANPARASLYKTVKTTFNSHNVALRSAGVSCNIDFLFGRSGHMKS